MRQKSSTIISSEAILKSKSGRSFVRENIAVTTENIEEFTPASETIVEATRRLQELGFTVSQSGVTMTVVGQKKRFEELAGKKLTIKKDKETGSTIVEPEEIQAPDWLRDVVEKFVFTKGEYF